MEITLHNTTKIVYLNGVEGRIWEGHTAGGIPIHAYIARIAFPADVDDAEISKELAIASEPTRFVAAISPRLIFNPLK